MIELRRRAQDGTIALHTIEDAAADEKLAWRASLPGASTFDRAAHVLRALQGDGAPAASLLSLAMPASWTVNAKASSRTFQRWLSEPGLSTWTALLDALPFDLSPEDWLARSEAERNATTSLVASLAGEGLEPARREGASLVAVTKVLALLRPQLVPLMDDAAIAFAIEAVPVPTSADAPTAPASQFVPMLDWFASEVVRLERELIGLASRHSVAIIDAAQALDRLLWVESWGERLRISRRL